MVTFWTYAGESGTTLICCQKRPLKRYTQGSLRQMGAKCRSKVLQNAPWEHFAILLTCIIQCLVLSGLLRQVLLYTIKFNGYPI